MSLQREVLSPLLALLEDRVGLRLSGNPTQVLGAFDALADELGLDSTALLASLERDAELLEALAAELTINETHFYRIGPQIDALRETVLPDLETRSTATRGLRFWSAGCSTGEEAYTLAMLASETLAAQTHFTVIGTDLHPATLETARAGLYGPWSFRDTPQSVRDSHFSTAGGVHAERSLWQIKSALRQRVRFSQLNLLSADWSQLERFDLILCRNVMIYFSNAVAQRLIERLAEQLQPGGWLILGPSDPPPMTDTLELSGLTVRYVRGAILYQKQPAGGSAPRATKSVQSTATLELPPFELPPLEPRRSQPDNVQPSGFQSTAQAAAGSHDVTALISDAALAQDVDLELQLGMHALEAGNLPAALAALRRATYLEPHSALAQFLLAKALQGSGQPERARVALRQAQRWLPRSDSSAALQRAVAALHVVLGDS